MAKNLRETKLTKLLIQPQKKLLSKASKANKKDIDDALLSAEKGFKSLEKYSTLGKIKSYMKISDLIRKRNDPLSKWLTLEVGKTLKESVGEVMVLQIYLNGVQKKLKEFMVKLYQEEQQIQEFMFIINQ